MHVVRAFDIIPRIIVAAIVCVNMTVESLLKGGSKYRL